MMLFITSWCNPLKTDTSEQRDTYLFHLTKAFFCQTNILINLYMSATGQLKNFQLFGCPKANFDLE